MDRIDPKAELPSHTPGCPKGEELVRRKGREAGRGEDRRSHRTARDATSICAKSRDPIDPRMPHLPPA